MTKKKSANNRWSDCRIGITGANGALGKALTKKLRAKGAWVIGFTHSPIKSKEQSLEGPQEWVQWQCGQETALDNRLEKIDVLVLNHGINPKGEQSPKVLNETLEINALSTWRLMERFEKIVISKSNSSQAHEIWVNTSEAEIQPALSPAYEISKRLIGNLVSLRWVNLDTSQQKVLRIRKLILGPFHSELNPLGIMSADFVASQIIKQAECKFPLIIVTPNPITYLAMPIVEVLRALYSILMKRNSSKDELN